jgi:hypothetical protein
MVGFRLQTLSLMLLVLAIALTVTECYSRPLSSSSSGNHLIKQHIDTSSTGTRIVAANRKLVKLQATKAEGESGLSAERIKGDIKRTIAWVTAAGLFAGGLTFFLVSRNLLEG